MQHKTSLLLSIICRAVMSPAAPRR